MVAFDRSDAEQIYRDLSPEELVVIASTDSGYLPEARNLAIAELERRGLGASRDELTARGRREIEYRQQRRDEAEMVAHERRNKARETLGDVFLIMMLWTFAAVAPFGDFGSGHSPGWMEVALAGVWVFFVIDAIRKAMRGDRLRLYLVVIGPICLFLISFGIALAVRGAK